ncbi:hypothetical protein [Friedmanniella luteola]|uniref:hypothetical protein n=1 Tax=Friedmanniella luteola TaxID=546871 RepID=UPI0012FD5B25|nr:hypothetical protein [Friedmanniella luteola]
MIKPELEWLLASWVRLVRSRWAATGMSREDRAVLLRQRLKDLAAARAVGATINELVATVALARLRAGPEQPRGPQPLPDVLTLTMGSAWIGGPDRYPSPNVVSDAWRARIEETSCATCY